MMKRVKAFIPTYYTIFVYDVWLPVFRRAVFLDEAGSTKKSLLKRNLAWVSSSSITTLLSPFDSLYIQSRLQKYGSIFIFRPMASF